MSSSTRSSTRSCFILGLVALSVTPAVAEPEPISFDTGLATGSWPDSVEIDLPPAPRGSAPSVQLVADHGTVEGELGSGWRLVAGSKITRHSTNGGVPNYTSDLYRLDGMDLVQTAANWQPETWDGTVLTYDAGTNTWTRKKEGWVWTYGTKAGTGTNATKLLADAGQAVALPGGGNCANNLCKTSTWYLSKVQDPFGNVMTYNYVVPALAASVAAKYPFADSRQYLPTSIIYGTARVDFTWQARPEPRVVSDNGRVTVLGQRLKGITTKVGTAKFSRYELQYEDETAPGALLSPLTDCDGQAVVAGGAPTQSLLRKIVRIGTGTGTAPTPQRTLRCMRSHHEGFAWGTAEGLEVIDQPTDGDDPTRESVIPLAVNLDRDGISDLVVIGLQVSSGGSYTVTPKAYVATPNVARGFAPATGGGTPAAFAAAWEAQLALRLTSSLFADHRGFALVDQDGDREPELYWEDSAGDVMRDRMRDDGSMVFTSSNTSLDGCDLRHGDFADIDGDGKLDLVVRAHGAVNGCAAESDTRWIRNASDSATATTLMTPFETVFAPAAWTAAVANCPAGVSWPTDYNPDWNADSYKADHVRYGDFNNDGKADAAIALHACWDNPVTDDPLTTDINEAEWHPVGNTVFSRIYWGTGYGTFVDSTLSAGPPLTYELDEAGSSGVVTGRILPGVLAPVDLDRNGLVEVLSTAVSTEGTGLMINRSTGAVTGFGVQSAIATNQPSATGGTRPSFMSYVSGGAECYRRSQAQAYGDFDGDGFADAISFALDETGASGCAAGAWCVNLYRSARTATEGRMISSDGPWGGRTSLTWGFSATEPHDNPNLEVNLEVLEQVVGAEGKVTLTYSGAFTTGGDPTPFAQVERRNVRGGRDVFGFVTAPWAAGRPSHAARYRTDDSLEHATVYVHGRVVNGTYQYNVRIPYFNPLSRRCDYDVGHASAAGAQSVSLESLIDRCYDYIGIGPLSAGQEGFSSVPDEYLPEVLGQTDGAIQPGGLAVYQASFGGSAHSFGAIATADAWASYSAVYSPAFTMTTFYRWALPPELAAVTPPVSSAQSSYTYPTGMALTAVIEMVDEWDYLFERYKLERSVEYRDTATLADDRIHTYTLDKPLAAGDWWRILRTDVTNRAGQRLASEIRASFVSTFTPKSVSSCGSDGVTCRVQRFTFDAAGDLLSHTFPDGGVETWTRGACGLPATHVDPVLRTQTNTITNCRISATTFEGSTTSWTFDGIGRLTRTVVAPGVGAATTIDQYYDDAFTFREDALFAEPRIGTKRSDGQATLRYLDGFGRPTKELECQSTAGSGTGVLASVRCLGGTERTTRLDVLGSDGRLKIRTEPFLSGETPVTHGVAHDGYGRMIVALEPQHTSAPGWTTTTYKRGPGWISVTDAAGRTARTDQTTLWREDRLNDTLRTVETFDIYGQVVDRTAADGLTTRHTYDVLGDLATRARVPTSTCTGANEVAGPCSSSTQYLHDLGGRVIRETAPDGVRRDFTYDKVGRLLSTTVTANNVSTVIESRTYRRASAVAGPEVDIVDESGAVQTIRGDGLGRVVEVDLLDTSEAFTWGANGLPAQLTDRNGRTSTFGYDIHDQLVRITVADGASATMTRNGRGQLTATVDADGVVERSTFAYSGRPLTTVLDETYTTREQAYDVVGRVTSELSGGVRTATSYDLLGRLVTFQRGLGAQPAAEVITVTYDAGDRVLSRTVTPAVGASAVTSYVYDAWGRNTSSVDPMGKVWTTEYDVVDRVRVSRDPEGRSTIVRYDERGRPVARRTKHGWSYTDYSAGETWDGTPALARIDAYDDQDLQEGASTTRYVDATGREVAAIDRNGLVKRSTHSGMELVGETWSDSAGALLAARDYAYDDAGRLAFEQGPYGALDAPETYDFRAYTYTLGGRVATLDVPEQTTSFTYLHGLVHTEAWDDQVRTFERTAPDATWVTRELLAGTNGALRTRTLTRDQLGHKINEVVTATGVPTVTTARSGFTAYGRPTLETRAVDGVIEATTAWAYDLAGRPTSRTLTTDAVATTTWSWSASGQLAQRRTPSGAIAGYTYDADGRLASVLDGAGVAYAIVRGRDLRGALTSLELPGEGETRTFSYELGLPRTRSNGPTGGAATFAWSADERDLFGRLVQETYVSGAETWTNLYTYTGRGRIAEEVRGRASEHRRHTWSPGGNHLMVELDTGSGFAPTMEAVYAGQLLTSVNGVAITHDPWQATLDDQHGNQLDYTADGEVRTITGPSASAVTFIRDASGIPVAQDEGGAQRRRIAWGLDASDLPAEVVDADGVVRTYVTAEGVLVGTRDGANLTSAEVDDRGALVRWGGAVAGDDSVFGEGAAPPVGADAERFVYGGLDLVPGAVGLHLARHRVYDAQTGRFGSPDPMGLAGGLHRFLYAEGDPIRFRDPMGWSSCLPVTGGGVPNINVDPLEVQTYDFQDSGADSYSVFDAVASQLSQDVVRSMAASFDIDLSGSGGCPPGVVACDPGPGTGDPIPFGPPGTESLFGANKDASGEGASQPSRSERRAERAAAEDRAKREEIAEQMYQDCLTLPEDGSSCSGGGGGAGDADDATLDDLGSLDESRQGADSAGSLGSGTEGRGGGSSGRGVDPDDEYELDDGLDLPGGYGTPSGPDAPFDPSWTPNLLNPQIRPFQPTPIARGPWDLEAPLQEAVKTYADDLGLPTQREISYRPDGFTERVRLDISSTVAGVDNVQTIELKRDVDGPRARPTVNQAKVGIPDSPKDLSVEVRGKTGAPLGLESGDKIKIDVEYMNPVDHDIGGYVHDLAVRNQLGQVVDGNTAKLLARAGSAGSKALAVVGALPTVWAMGEAAVESWNQGTPAPFVAQGVREGVSWGLAEAGGALGAAVCAPGGPIGAGVGYLGGSTVGGGVGYELGDWFADTFIYDDGQ